MNVANIIIKKLYNWLTKEQIVKIIIIPILMSIGISWLINKLFNFSTIEHIFSIILISIVVSLLIKKLTMEHIFSIIIMPIVISIGVSIGVSLLMEDIFTKQQIKKELSLNISTLQDDIVRYNEVYSLNSPFNFLLLLDLDKSIILNSHDFQFFNEILQESIRKGEGTQVDIALAKYLLTYTRKSITSENVAYFKLIRLFENYKQKYQIIKTELELINSKINLLNNELECARANLLNNIYSSLKKREELNEIFFLNMLKEVEVANKKGAHDFEAYKNLKDKISPLYIIDTLSNKTIEEKLSKNEDKINNLIQKLIQLNGAYLLDYDNEEIVPNEYCKKMQFTRNK